MDREALIREARDRIQDGLDDALDVVDDEAILRFALYLIAREILEGHVDEIVWIKPPFPEVGDQEARP